MFRERLLSLSLRFTQGKALREIATPPLVARNDNWNLIPCNDNWNLIPRNDNWNLIPHNGNWNLIPLNDNWNLIPRNDNLNLTPFNGNWNLISRNNVIGLILTINFLINNYSFKYLYIIYVFVIHKFYKKYALIKYKRG